MKEKNMNYFFSGSWFDRKKKLLYALTAILIFMLVANALDPILFQSEVMKPYMSYTSENIEDMFFRQNLIEGLCVMAGLLMGYLLYRREIHEHYN